jgi:hypothetical protein
MRTLEEIKAGIIDYLFDGPQSHVCASIVDMLGARRCENLEMLTYQSLAKATHRGIDDPTLVMAVQFLVTSERFHLLDQHYLVIDEHEPDGVMISDEEVAEAYRTGVLIHPSGNEISDFENILLPYFSASADLRAIKEGP